ncbi:acid-sensing ion channel 4-B-like [Halichondria panicea]|uniref:acid-sensing ion channel 4-B-like n=1 Tax=Halichondria panicea TaxID=6063 RepID=UPI00312B66FF
MDLEMSTKSTSKLQQLNNASENVDAARTNKERAVHRLDKFGDNSSFSAAVYEFKSKSIIKRLLWGLIVILAIAGFCYITAQSINMLIEEPISTSITEMRQRELEFPAVTVCSLSFLDTTVLKDFSNEQYNNEDLANRLANLFAAGGPPNVPPLTECISIANEITSNTGFDIGFGNLILDVAKNDPIGLIEQCSFQGNNCTNDLEIVNTISGVCFTFNGLKKTAKPHKVQGTGVLNGLRLQIRNGDQEFSLNSNYGFNVIVHNRDEPPRPESEGVVVGLGSSLNVGMQQVTSAVKTQFYSGQDCVTNLDNPSNNLTFSEYSSYSRSLCLNDCFYTHIANECQCVEKKFYTPVRSPYTEMKDCGSTDICCEVYTFETFKDSCNCPLKCETIDRTLTTSSATHSLNNGPNAGSMVGINVYYESLVTEVRETTDSYTPWSLISDIGGNTGLFLGFTLLTMGEVLLLVLGLCTDCCCFSCKKRWNRKQLTV